MGTPTRSPSMSSLISQGKINGAEDEMALQRLAALYEENTRLRRSLVAQINQRAYFQEEYRKAQSRCAIALQEQHTIQEDNSVLQKRVKELCSLIDVHERTNEALQRQLADAYTDDTGDKEQCKRMRETINKLSDELEVERNNHKTVRLELERQELDRSESGELWADRVALLQEQLKLSNNLKEEYKRRLKSTTPEP
jgi:hypothetical protein